MKVSLLTRISSTAPEICRNILLNGNVLYTKRIFLCCHGPTEYTVILVGSILQVLQGFVVCLQCESLASQIHLEVSNAPHYCTALILYNLVLRLCWAQLLAGVAYKGTAFPHSPAKVQLPLLLLYLSSLYLF